MILKTKYLDIKTDSFSFKNPKQMRKRLENSFKTCFTDKPNVNYIQDNDSEGINLKYEPNLNYLSTPFPIDPDDLIFLNIGHTEGYKIMDDDYTCRGFHYEPNHSYSINEDPIMCKRGFHFCRELANCFMYYRPTASIDKASSVTYDLDIFKFFKVKSNGTTYKFFDKCCTNSISILDECTTEEILEAFKEHFNWRLFRPNKFKVKLRDELYEYYDNCFHKIIQNDQSEKLEKLNNQLTWTFYIPEED